MNNEPARILDQALRSTWQNELKATSDPTIKQRCLQQESELLPRFAEYYGKLKAIRRVRRHLQRQWKRSLAGIALLIGLGQGSALAATINVDGTTCTLTDAITAANTDAATGGCTAGSATDTLV